MNNSWIQTYIGKIGIAVAAVAMVAGAIGIYTASAQQLYYYTISDYSLTTDSIEATFKVREPTTAGDLPSSGVIFEVRTPGSSMNASQDNHITIDQTFSNPALPLGGNGFIFSTEETGTTLKPNTEYILQAYSLINGEPEPYSQALSFETPTYQFIPDQKASEVYATYADLAFDISFDPPQPNQDVLEDVSGKQFVMEFWPEGQEHNKEDTPPRTVDQSSGTIEFSPGQAGSDELIKEMTYLYEIVSVDGSVSYFSQPQDFRTSKSNSTSTTVGGGGQTTTQTDCEEGEYCLIEPLPGIDQIGADTSFGDYINQIMYIVIGIAGVLAVVMLIYRGIQYMTTEAVFKKGDAKKGIGSAIGGLLLAIGAVVILQTINPNLINIDLEPDTVSIVGGDYPTPITPNSIQQFAQEAAISCPKSGDRSDIPGIAEQFVDITTYRLGGKGNPDQPPYPEETGEYENTCPAGTVCLDCSGYIHRVLSCVGTPTPEGWSTEQMFTNNTAANNVLEIESLTQSNQSNSTSVMTTGGTEITLENGDLLGWYDDAEGIGHIVLYIGNNMIIHSASSNDGREAGNAVRKDNVLNYKTKYQYLIRYTDYAT